MTYKEKGSALGSVIKEVFILSCFAPGFIREMSLSNEDVVFKLFFKGGKNSENVVDGLIHPFKMRTRFLIYKMGILIVPKS